MNTPDSTGPSVPPRPATPPMMPMALARSLAPVNSRATKPKAAGEESASPVPCSSRLATIMPELVAAPLRTDAPAKRDTPIRNMRLRPSRSARRPPSSSSPPAVRT